MKTNSILCIIFSAGLIAAASLLAQAKSVNTAPNILPASKMISPVAMKAAPLMQLAQSDSCNSGCVDGAISRCLNVMGGSGPNWWEVGGHMHNCVAQSLPAQCRMLISAWRTGNAGQGGWVQVDTRPDSGNSNLNCISSFNTN